ncbi:MAG: MarC family protein [Planctomycetota bacterium]|jgi:multiple antibiotic resistance protein
MVEKIIRDAVMMWATIDPVGTLALFAAITSSLTAEQRKKTAFKATLYASFILIGSILIGQVLLSIMAISLISLQVAGGVILFLFALQMIFSNPDQVTSQQPEDHHNLAVFPLAIPSIASPGAIMAVIILTDNHLYSVPVQAGTALMTLAVILITYVLMRVATPILRVLGKNGAAILIRVSGLILASLAVQLVFEALGLENWVHP